MPIIKSAKKRMRQNNASRVVNHARKSEMLSLYKNIIAWSEKKEWEKVARFFDNTQKSIDMCAKNNIIHENNAARKKSRIAKLYAETPAEVKASQSTAKKKAPSKAKTSK